MWADTENIILLPELQCSTEVKKKKKQILSLTAKVMVLVYRVTE